MKILLVDDDLEFRLVLSLFLDKEFGAEVVEANNIQDATRALASNSFDLIISDYNMPSGTGGELFQYLEKKGNRTPFILCSSKRIETLPEFSGKSILGSALKPKVIPVIRDLISQLFKSTYKSPGFIEIPFGLLRHFDELPTSLYIKLSEHKFVRIFSAGDVLESSDLDRYEKKAITAFHASALDFDLFLDHMIQNYLAQSETIDFITSPAKLAELKSKLDNPKLISQIEMLSQKLSQPKASEHPSAVPKDFIRSLHELYQGFGYNENMEKLTLASISAALKIIRKIPRIEALFQRMHKEERDYLSAHTLELAKAACLIASAANWDNELTRLKLCAAAILHDITLENSEQALISSLSDPVIFENPGYYDKIRNHPLESARLARRFQMIPPDVDQIILTHHERPDGTGFPSKLKATEIRPLSAVFIVAHDLVEMKFESPNLSPRLFCKRQEKLYSKGAFRKILWALQDHVETASKQKKARAQVEFAA